MCNKATHLITDEEQEDIEILLDGGDYKLNNWEYGFLKSIEGLNAVSFKRRESLDQIFQKYHKA